MKNKLLLIEPERLAASLNARAKAEANSMKAEGGWLAYFFGETPAPYVTPGGVGVITIRGVINYGITAFEADTGDCDVRELQRAFATFEADPAVRSILLDIDSYGGYITGVPEFAAMVAASTKHVVAFTSTAACSAAYWLGAQAHEFIATPSAQLGSIGVYIALTDLSTRFAQEGVKIDVIKSGDLKAAGLPGTTLTDAQRADFQAYVDKAHAEFKSAVLARRALVEEDSMRGQSFKGDEAAERGLVTGLVLNREELMARLSLGDFATAPAADAGTGEDGEDDEETDGAEAEDTEEDDEDDIPADDVTEDDDEDDDTEPVVDDDEGEEKDDDEKPESSEDPDKEGEEDDPEASEDDEDDEDEE